MGGPDGARDLEATFTNGERAVGAIGFRNSPKDSAGDMSWVRGKFASDLKEALERAGEFQVFVFMTNVKLTVTERQKLLASGRATASRTIEVFDRENLRVTLDSPEGLAARFQYLQIPLSDAEQAAFFSRWGSELESLMGRSFAAVEERLRRLEFMHERDALLTNLSFVLRLRAPALLRDLPHLRAVLSVAKLTRREHSHWHVAICNNSPARALSSCGSGSCLATAFWLEETQPVRGSSASVRPDPLSLLAASGGFSEYSDPEVRANLADLGEAFFHFEMNRQLFDRLAGIEIFANEYLLWSATAESLYADAPNVEPTTPWNFSDDELADEWVRVMLGYGRPGQFDFSSTTPRRWREAQRLEG